MRIYFANYVTPETEEQYDRIFDRDGGEGADALIASQNRVIVLNIGKLYYMMFRKQDKSVNTRIDYVKVMSADNINDYLTQLQTKYKELTNRFLFRYDEHTADRWDSVQRPRIPKVREYAVANYVDQFPSSMARMFAYMADYLPEARTEEQLAYATRLRDLLRGRANYYDQLYNNHGVVLGLGKAPNNQVVKYKDTDFVMTDYYARQHYKTLRNMTHKLNELVRQAIAEEDTEDLDLYVKEYMNAHQKTHVAFHKKLKHVLAAKFGLQMQTVITDCGHFEFADEVHAVQSNTMCEACFDEYAVECADDGEMYHRNDLYYWESDEEYHLEEEPDDDDDDSSDDPDSLMDYSTNVLNHLSKDNSFTPSPYGELLMGVELEIGIGDRSQRQAVEGIRSSLGEDYVVCKYDGSLPDDGIEIVTAPRKLDHHIKQFKAWDVPSGYRAWDAKKCGMHIHIDSRGFSRMTLGKFFMFFNADSNADFIRKIAGRHPLHDNQAREYCAAEQQHILVNPSTAVKGKSTERYRIINTQNLSARECKRLGLPETYGRYNTVELRIFRATLNKARLLAQMEFTHAVVMFCRVASWRNLNGDSFVAWLSTTQNVYPHLSDWYGVRRKKAAKPVAAPVQDSCPDATPAPEAVTAEPRDVARARGRL